MNIYYPSQVSGRVRDLCIRKNWFNCGTNRQYDRMFDMLDRPEFSTRDIAMVIWTCSTHAALDDIIDELEEIEYLDYDRHEDETDVCVYVDTEAGEW